MAKRKKRKPKSKRNTFVFKGSKLASFNWKIFLQVLAAVVVLGAVGTGFIFLSKYVERSVAVSEKTGRLELADVPYWVSQALKERILYAARSNGEDFKLDNDAALSVYRNLAELVPWLDPDDTKVQVTSKSIQIKARWRKPVALIETRSSKFYVDEDLVVLDYLALPNLAIVKVKGLSGKTGAPSAGEVWQVDDLAAAAALLVRLDKMDSLVTSDKPLLFEIESIDVRNFNGRRNRNRPHIVLYTKDNAEIVWGAEIGMWQRYMEATDEEKLAKLYSYYKEYGTLLNSVKIINLRNPQDHVPQPIDKY